MMATVTYASTLTANNISAATQQARDNLQQQLQQQRSVLATTQGTLVVTTQVRRPSCIFPDFSGIHDFHKSKLSMKTYNFNQKLERFSELLLFQ